MKIYEIYGGGAKRPGAKRLWCESTRSWAKRLGAKRLWGESSIVRTVQGRIDHVVGESSRGRNVKWAKRLATNSHDNRNQISMSKCATKVECPI